MLHIKYTWLESLTCPIYGFLTLHEILSTYHNKFSVGCRGYDLDGVCLLVDALTLAKHFHGQNVTNFKQHVARNFLLYPVGVSWPVVEAFNTDFALDSELATNKEVNVRLGLLLTNQALVVVEDALFGPN